MEEARSAADIVKELAAQIQQIMSDIDDGLLRLKAAGSPTTSSSRPAGS